MLGSVELAGNQTTITGQDRIWSGNTYDLRQMLTAKSLDDLSEGGAFWV
jgi:hypothetical protein